MRNQRESLASPEIYFAVDYRSYLLADIDSHGHERGYQKRLADAAGCAPSYLSQVLHSHIHLTVDQAASLCDFWSFNDDRTEFFLALVQTERSSSVAFRRFLSKKLKNLREKHNRVSTRISSGERVTVRDDRAAYYASWYMSAMHVLTSIDHYQTPDALAERLRLPKSQVLSHLDELVRMGFIQYDKNRFKSLVQSIHVEQGSPLNLCNHFQWRHRAMAQIIENDRKGLHYTAIHALSLSDAKLVREMALKFIQESRAVVEPSKEEEAVAICLDMFPV